MKTNDKLTELLKKNGISAVSATMSATGVAVRVSSKTVAALVESAFKAMNLKNIRQVVSFDEIVCIASHE